MPIRVQNNLPVKEILEHENIFVMDEHRDASGYPSDSDRAFESDAFKGGHRASDTPFLIQYAAADRRDLCKCVQPCGQEHVYQPY